MRSSTFTFKSKRLVVQWLVLVVAFGTILSVRAGAAEPGFVLLTVRGPGNVLLPGAAIRVAGRTGYTGSKGIAKFELSPGRYVIDVMKSGYRRGRITVTIRPRVTVRAGVGLARLPRHP